MLHYEYHFHVVFIQLFKPLRNYLSSSTLILMGFAIRSSLLGFKGLDFGTKTCVQCPAYIYQHIQNHYIKPRAILRKIQIQECILVFSKLILSPLQFSFLCFTQFSFRFH